LRVVTPRSTSGHGLSFAGQPERALADTTEALELARRLNYAEGEAMVLWHHGEVLVAAGRPDQGLAAAEAGVVLARRLGHRGWTAATLCGLGVAHAAVGDFEAAAQAYRDSLVLTEHLVMFKTWGHARLARLLVQHGDLAGAATHVDAALGTGPGLAQYEARLARCELAVARNEADASALVQDALDRAVDGGHGASAIRLAELGGQP
jgi:tetratricopeptide (TPR) repeat protein